MKESVARNHHFISQAEQRLNAIDKTVKKKNQRIFKFEVLCRETPSLRAGPPSGVRIEDNLARLDLYALSVLDGGQQYNLEDAFGQYENDSSSVVRSIFEKLDSSCTETLGEEIRRLYALKLLNMIRNPYTIKTTLKMFSELNGAVPADEKLRAQFESFRGASRPQIVKTCTEFDISEDEYIAWLNILYLVMLQPVQGKMNLLEALMNRLFSNPDAIKSFTVHRYTDLVKDKGILLCDQMIDLDRGEGVKQQMFNLDSSSFVVVLLIEAKKQEFLPLGPDLQAVNLRQNYLIHVEEEVNNMAMLGAFNRHCVYLANSSVFCAFDTPYGISVAPQDLPAKKSDSSAASKSA